MKYSITAAVGPVLFALFAVGCSSQREVEVSGTVTAPATLQVQGKLVLEFLDVTGEGDAVETSVVSSSELTKLGDFSEKVSLEGDRVIVRVIADGNADGKCSAGEAWGQSAAVLISDEDEAAVSFALSLIDCPKD